MEFLGYCLILCSVFVINGSANENKTNALGLSGTAATLKIKCHNCISAEFMPAFAIPLFKNWNLTDFGEYSTLASTCDMSTSKLCNLGEICAKGTHTYSTTYQGSTYEHKIYVHLCASKNLHGTDAIPSSGQCYADKSPDSNKKADGVELSSSWCYCRNEDYCNESSKVKLTLGLLIAIIFGIFY